MTNMPVPHDLPLPLPGTPAEFQFAIVVLFLLHIVFVNLMLGTTLMALFYEVRGWKNPDYDRLARELAGMVTVHKSLAVVLGVGPLLVANVYYTVYMYSANALTGTAWMMVVPLVAAAFLLTYVYKYSWDKLIERRGLHLAIGAAGAAIFLTVPLIFLSNINLMLFPDKWLDVRGFFSAMLMANVLPRYLHFLLASLAVTALLLAGWFGRASYPAAERFSFLTNDELRRHFLAIAFGASALQFIAGPLVYFTLPEQGVNWRLVLLILVGASVGLFAVWRLWLEMLQHRDSPGRGYWLVVAALTLTVVFMGSIRHYYRELSLGPHRALVEARTSGFEAMALGARMRAEAGILTMGESETAFTSPGQKIFQVQCNACHAVGAIRVGPPLEEIAAAYVGDPAGLIAWVKAPGRKRTDFPQMPPIRLSDRDYQAVAGYVIDKGWAEEP